MAKPSVRNPGGNIPDDESVAIGLAFGRRVTLICESRGIVASELDRQIGVERGTIWAIMRGARGSKATGIFIARVADGLDVDMEWLFTGRGSEHAFARKGFIACGIAPSSSLWPLAAGRLAEAIVSAPRSAPAARKKRPPPRATRPRRARE
jgi:transcriptional regulator with XRE-family HTH domain